MEKRKVENRTKVLTRVVEEEVEGRLIKQGANRHRNASSEEASVSRRLNKDRYPGAADKQAKDG